ncbi:MAG: hypothetical protein RL093_587 [Pseudomonadota bacterium]
MRAGRAGVPAQLVSVGLIAVCGLGAGGCVSDPGYVAMGEPDGSPYGYSDVLNADGSHTIRVLLPASVPDPQNAYVYWNRRAEEICGGPPASKTLHTAQRAVIFVDARSAQAVRGDYYLEGLARCAGDAEATAVAP